MVKTQRRAGKPKSLVEHDRYTAELSSSQLVMGVCMLLVFGLGCFLLGIVIGRFDPSLRTTVAAIPATQLEQDPLSERIDNVTATTTVKSPPPEMRVPRRLVPPPQAAVVKETAPTKETASAKKTTPKKETPPASEAAKDKTAEAKTEPAPAPTEPVAETPKEQAKSEPTKLAKVEDTANTKVRIPAGTPVATANTSTTSKPATTPKTPVATRYGVQVAAFQTSTNAARVKSELEVKSAYTARLVDSSSGKLIKVVVGSYVDHASAEIARVDLRDRMGYKDCFITELN